jgi:hypothetical protein
MLLTHADKLPKESPVFIALLALSLFGLFDISKEIIEDHQDMMSKNFVKKVILFSALYLKTESIYTSSLLSIIIVLSFPKVFFGPQSRSKSNC